MDIDDEDQHICLSCHNIFTGLNSYINHRKNECPNRKQNRPAKEKVDFVDLPVASVSHDGAQSSDSAHQQALQAIDILNQITNDKQTQPTHQSATEQQETVADAFISQNDSVPNASVANSVVSLPMDINCTPSLVNSALSPSSNRIVDPNMVLYEGEKHLADFFTSLELQSRNTNADVGKSADKGLEIESAAADFLSMNQSSADIDSTLRIANILNDLGFSSESDDDLNNYDCDVNFSDESGDESRPPSGYTGGKWKPGSQPASHQNNRQTWKAPANAPPENHTRGKWKPGSTPEQHRGGKWRPSSSPPPENHTRGKWKPGRGPPEGYGGGKWKPTADESDSENEKAHEDAENVNSHDQEETTSAINGSEVVNELHMESKSRKDSDENVAKTGVDSVTKKSEEQMLIEPTFHCETCDRTLLTEKSYESHLKTRLHAKRTKEKDNPTEKIVIASPRENSEEIDCPICIRTFNNKYNFARHLVSVVHKEAARDQGRDLMLVEKYQLLVSRLSPYQCKVCAFYCNNSEDLEIHLNTSEHASKVLSITGPLLCVRCAFNTEQNKEMIQHMKSKEHIDTVQKSKRPCVIKEQRYRIRCKLCDQLFISASRLFGHMRRYHSIKVLDKCKSTKCPHCGQEFKSVFAMSLHVRRKHTTERPFKCNFCQVAFIDSYSLKLHEKTRKHLNAVTGNPEQQEQQETRKRGRPPSMGKCRGGVFKCDHCNFKTKKKKVPTATLR